ncbi:MAG: lysophospholipid acyltransferase family protein [Acidobacteriota bacterium]|nr:lysophospholipid acyltransferase family protein [Acidobacteriota bacterium]
MREKIEYWLVRAIAWTLGLMPRSLARFVSDGLAGLVYVLFGRLRRVGRRNLEMAYPSLSPEDRQRILKGVYRSLGRQLVEFCRMSRYTAANTKGFIRTEGLYNYLAARDRGKGVLVLTGHLGAWELSSFYHSLMGHSMGMVIRRLDNRHLDRYVNSIRCMHGNKVLHKDDFARGLLTAMHQGETVGILMDTNMTPPQGVFAKFFGKEACTGSGLARVALKTGATVLPGFMVWEAEERKYVLHFGPPLAFEATGNLEADVVSVTRQCNDVLEAWIRRYPDQWLWIHRRWKTRPSGEPALYSGKHGAISGSHPVAGDSK